MAEEGKGVALAILGIVAVIAVVGLILLFTGATAKVSAPFEKTYGGVNRYEEYPYLVDRTTGGMADTAGTPDAIYYPAGFMGAEEPNPVMDEEHQQMYAASMSGTNSPRTAGRQPYYIPSGQICSEASGEPGFRCPQNTYCIPDPSEADSAGWQQVVGPCYARVG